MEKQERNRKSMNLGINNEELQSRQSLREGETAISDRLFHFIFGGTLAWGLLLNVILVNLFQLPMLNLVLRAGTVGLILMLVAYIALVIVGNRLIHANGVGTSFLGFNLIAVPIGLLLSVAVAGYEPALVQQAMLITLLATVIMIIAGMLFPRFFSGIGPMLGISLIACIISELICALFFHNYSFGFTDWVVAGIMCLYIGYDWGRLCTCARTANNAVDLAANMFLDIINLFLRVLQILSKLKGDD